MANNGVTAKRQICEDDIGKNIREQRTKRKMSLADLGALLDVTPQAVYQYEYGKRSLKFDMIERIATALDVPVAALLCKNYVITGKSNKVKPLPNKWVSALTLKESLLPECTEDEETEALLEDPDFQIFLNGLLTRLKMVARADRALFLHQLQGEAIMIERRMCNQ